MQYLGCTSTENIMPSSLSIQSLARLGAIGSVVARAQVLAAAAGYFFYGYWFSQRRA
jgi:hypothetical protein